MSIDDVVARVDEAAAARCRDHGRRAAAPADVYPLMRTAARRGQDVLLETGGHRSSPTCPTAVVGIMDVKCPGTGEAGRYDWENLRSSRRTTR